MKLMTIKDAYKAPSGAYQFYVDWGNGKVQVEVDQDVYDEPGTYTVMEVDGDHWIWMDGSALIEYELAEGHRVMKSVTIDLKAFYDEYKVPGNMGNYRWFIDGVLIVDVLINNASETYDVLYDDSRFIRHPSSQQIIGHPVTVGLLRTERHALTAERAALKAERDQLIRAQQSAIKTLQQGIGFAGREYDGWTLGQFIAATIERYAAKEAE